MGFSFNALSDVCNGEVNGGWTFVALLQQVGESVCWNRSDGTPSWRRRCLVGDASKKHVFVNVWGQVSRTWFDGSNPRIKIGDIVCFHEFRVKRFRGSIEIHNQSISRIELIARKGTIYHDTGEVALMSEVSNLLIWSRHHFGYLLDEGSIDLSQHVQCKRIADVQENTIVHIVARIQRLPNATGLVGEKAAALSPPGYIRFLVYDDNAMDASTMPLLIQQDTPLLRSILKRPLGSDATFYFRNLLVEYNQIHGEMIFIPLEHGEVERLDVDDERYQIVANKLRKNNQNFQKMLKPRYTIEDLAAPALNGVSSLVIVHIAGVYIEELLDVEWTPKNMIRMVQASCSHCRMDCTILEENQLDKMNNDGVVPLVAPCRNHKCIGNEKPGCVAWKFKGFSMLLRDAIFKDNTQTTNQSSDTSPAYIEVEVPGSCTQSLFGNISAEAIVGAVASTTTQETREAFLAFLTAMVLDNQSQAFEAQLYTLHHGTSNGSPLRYILQALRPLVVLS